MSKRNRVNGQGVPCSPPAHVEIDGGSIDLLIISGEAWVAPEIHRQALAMIEEQAAELERLKSGKAPEPGELKLHLRCPSCWNGQGGRAARRKWQRPVNGVLQHRCYVCNQCGTEWVAEVRSEEEDGVLYTTTKVVEVRESAPA